MTYYTRFAPYVAATGGTFAFVVSVVGGFATGAW